MSRCEIHRILILGLIITSTLPYQYLNGQRRVSEEARIFSRVKESILTVYGDRGHGSGFLIDSIGLVLTNQHVIESSRYIRIQLNDSVKVKASLLAEDSHRDVAVLRIHPTVCEGIIPLPLSAASDTMVFVGEKVIAIGSPLNQMRIMTAGIVSKVEPDVVISDVNINPGNSGGPMINMDGNCIGINTFGDFSNRGPGVSGSLLITEAGDVIRKAYEVLGEADLPSKERLPVMPKDSFPLDALRHAATVEKFYEKPYDLSKYSTTGKFVVRIATPPYDYYREKRLEVRLSQKRGARETIGGIGEQARYDPFTDLKAWATHTGEYSPVVKFEVQPKIGQTATSVLSNVLLGALAGYTSTYYRGTYEYEFKGDLYDFKVYRNGIKQTDIMRAMIMQPLVFTQSTWGADYKAEDMAQVGSFTFPIELFKPENGALPRIKLEIFDIESPEVPQTIYLPTESIEKVWADFGPYTGDLVAAAELEKKFAATQLQQQQAAVILPMLGIVVLLLLLATL